MRACRACLSRHDLSPVFEELELTSEQLFIATGVKISPNDGLPQTICKSCIKTITKTLNFREICTKVDEYFKTTNSHIIIKTELNDFENADEMFENLTNPFPASDISMENYHNSSQHNQENVLSNKYDFDVDVKPVIGQNLVMIDIKTDFSEESDISIETNQLSNQQMTDTCFVNQEVKRNQIASNNIPRSHNAKIESQNNTRKQSTNILNILQKLTNSKNRQTEQAGTSKNYIKVDHNYSRMITSVERPNQQREQNTKSITRIEDHRKRFLSALIKNFRETKVILTEAQKRLQERLEQNRKDTRKMENKSRTANVQKEIISTKLMFPKRNFFQERNKLMSLAVTPINPKGPIRCKICRKLLRHRNSFKAHAMTHFRPQFICQTCGMSFTQRGQLSRHQQTRGHGAEKKFGCPQCSYRAADRASMRNHVRAVHTGERPYECNECGMTFRMRNNIVQHLSTHFGVKNIQCELCPSRFKRRSELWLHQQKTHYYTHTHYCYLCPKTYSHVGDVRKHLVKIHGVPRDQQLKIAKVKTKKDGGPPQALKQQSHSTNDSAS